MAKSSAVQVRLSLEAEADLESILEWSETRFGAGAATRYAELVIQALHDLKSDSDRPNARSLQGLQPGLFSYHLANSRHHVTGDRVKTPRHFIVFRRYEGVLDVIRILHDSRDLGLHLPDELEE